MAFEVQPGLFVGSQAVLDDIPALGITHVVSVLNSPETLSHPNLPPAPAHQHTVDVEDDENANLLQLLPGAVGFVEGALTCGGRVLVHCAAGVSRSPAVAAAYLMKSQGLTPSAALAALRRSHPGAAPNAGFLSQLELFHAMGCSLQEGHVPYKRFLLERLGRQYEESGTLDGQQLAQPEEPADGMANLYRCRKCRALVATSHNVVEVEQGPGASAFSWRKRDKQQRQITSSSGGGEGYPGASNSPAAAASPAAAGGGAGGGSEEGGSLFVEPLQWMAESLVGGPVQGKLYCPKCQARLGSFSWAGAQSSSGAWVVPSFQLHCNRLDAVDPRPSLPLAAIRQPRMLPSQAASPKQATAASGVGAQQPQEQQQCSGGSGCAAPAAAADLAQQLQQGAVLSGAPPAAAAPAAAALSGTSEGGAATADGGLAPLRFSYLVLDCDGVMVNSEAASCEALRQSILQVTGFDIPHTFPKDYEPVFGMDVRSCVDYYKHRFSRDDWADPAAVAAEVTATKEGIYQRLTADGVPAFEGVAELIRAAQRLGLGVAVASSGTPEKIKHNLSSSGLWGMVDEHLVVSAKYVARGKPAPDVYVEALKRLGCQDASRALVVEDAVNGIKAAKAAGCFTVGITNSLPRHLLEPHADVVVDLIHECEQLLASRVEG